MTSGCRSGVVVCAAIDCVIATSTTNERYRERAKRMKTSLQGSPGDSSLLDDRSGRSRASSTDVLRLLYTAERVVNRGVDRLQSALDVLEVYPKQPAPARREHFVIAAGLRELDRPEAVSLPWHRQIMRIVCGDLEKDAGVRSPFVGLTGRVQEARPKPD